MTTDHAPSRITIPPATVTTGTATAPITIRPDFTGLNRAFADMGIAIRAAGERLARLFESAGLHPPAPRRANSLSTAYHRRHVRNRRRRSRR